MSEPQLRRKYPFDQIEPKWQRHWLEHKTFAAKDDTAKPKLYVLDMFPYPSGAGLHVGHPEGYTATDIFCRYKRMRGFNVLHPMGWDAFGLPAEQYAIDTGTHPSVTTKKNIDTFRRQIQMLGFSYDWDREVDTTDPHYFKWTQWIFLQLYKKGLAYEAEVPVWWCDGCKAVLANEEVNADGTCDRKGHKGVYRRPLRQWILRITAYAERLLADLEHVNWPHSIKEQQRNWIGRSEGANVEFAVAGSDLKIEIFTTRPDTLFGATYMVLAPEHPLVDKVTTAAQKSAVDTYRSAATKKSEIERGMTDKEKTGVFTGGYAVNPVNDEKIPIWIADYVMMGYGTGAIMAVPAHDTRDFEFAKKFGLEIRTVVQPPAGVDPHGFTGDGVSVNSGPITGLPTPEAKKKITEWLGERGLGEFAVNYKLRDWLFSRQRYWGEPIPIVHCAKCGTVPVPESELPLRLPEMKDYSPSGNAEPPLAKATDWVNCQCPQCGGAAKRETNTMPQWAGSCWYYLRYIDPKNAAAFVAKDKEKYWMPVDLYVGGAEHAVLHLLYSRFWHKVLFDLGHVSTPEPFTRLVNQGMILGEIEYLLFKRTDVNGAEFEVSASDLINITPMNAGKARAAAYHKDDPNRQVILGYPVSEGALTRTETGFALKDNRSIRVHMQCHKMSKSWGNVINPDDVVKEYGADTLRLYEMFMGPLEATKPWSMEGVQGIYRFLGRVWRLYCDEEGKLLVNDAAADTKLVKVLHQTIKKVGDDTEALAFNTAISQMMIFVNELTAQESRPRAVLEPFALLLAPYAPHIAEELWQKLGHTKTLSCEPWPQYDESLLVETTVQIVVQVNGKVRTRLDVPAQIAKEELEKLALAHADVQPFLTGKQVKKVIVVPGKLVNIAAA